MKRSVWLSSLMLLVLSISGCGCNAALRIRLSPSTVTLTVGETAPPPQLSVQECFEPWQAVELETWKSEDPDIASVNTDTGLITGVAPGETTIIAEGEEFGGIFPVAVITPTTAAK